LPGRFLKVGVANGRAIGAGDNELSRRHGEETSMTATDERTALAQATEAAGWHRREVERVDVYLRGISRVRVIWRGNDAISGGSRFTDDSLEQYSRDLNTIKNWLK
jgi:hypothetical protein